MTREFDAVRFLKSDKRIRKYMNGALASNDENAVAFALRRVIEARALTELAENAGIERSEAYATLYGPAPSFATFVKLVPALGFSLSFAKADPRTVPIDAELAQAFADKGKGERSA